MNTYNPSKLLRGQMALKSDGSGKYVKYDDMKAIINRVESIINCDADSDLKMLAIGDFLRDVRDEHCSTTGRKF